MEDNPIKKETMRAVKALLFNQAAFPDTEEAVRIASVAIGRESPGGTSPGLFLSSLRSEEEGHRALSALKKARVSPTRNLKRLKDMLFF